LESWAGTILEPAKVPNTKTDAIAVVAKMLRMHETPSVKGMPLGVRKNSRHSDKFRDAVNCIRAGTLDGSGR
jgi:hypothetical protein